MTTKTFLLAGLLLVLSGCASTPQQLYQPLPPVKVITETVEKEIYQPPLPPEIQLDTVEFVVLTDSPCRAATGKDTKTGLYTTGRYEQEEYTREDGTTGTRNKKDENGNNIELPQLTHGDGEPIEVCGNMAEKIYEVEQQTGSEFVMFAVTPQAYENMAYNLQEIRRYMRQQKEIILYYREATKPKDRQGWLDENAEAQQNQLDAAAADNAQQETQQYQIVEPEQNQSPSLLDRFNPFN